MVPLEDLVRPWVSAFHNLFPQSLLNFLDAVYANAVAFTDKCFIHIDASLRDTLASLTLQSVLPPIISLLTIYFTLISLYHTTSFFVRGTIFLVRWGLLIGIVAAVLGLIANAVMPGTLHRSTGKSRNSRSGRPRVWDTFEDHQRWRESLQEEYSPVADAGRVAREMVEKLVDTTKQVAEQGGWWSTLAGIATDTVVGDTDTSPTRKKRRPKNVRGKGKSR